MVAGLLFGGLARFRVKIDLCRGNLRGRGGLRGDGSWNRPIGCGITCRHDKDGQEIDSEFKARAISIDLDDFRKIPERIFLAGGWNKTECIRGLLRGGLISTIIMDSITASELVGDPAKKEKQ